MNRKPRKVEEPSGSYAAKPAKAAVRRASSAAFRKAADKVFKTHEGLFRKLAQ